MLLSIDSSESKQKMKTKDEGKNTLTARVVGNTELLECCLKEPDNQLPELTIFGNVSPEIGYLGKH